MFTQGDATSLCLVKSFRFIILKDSLPEIARNGSLFPDFESINGIGKTQ